MNGYVLGNGRYLAAETGADITRGGKATRVVTDRDSFTDLWGSRDTIMAELSREPDAYIHDGRGTFAASVPTGNGRVYYHDTDLSPWEPPAEQSASRVLLTLDKLAGIIKRRALQYNPAFRGISIIGSTRERHADWFQSDDLPESPSADPTPNFTTKTPYDRNRQWLHVYDVRAAWLSAARTAPTGYGSRELLRAFNSKREALWQVRPTSPGLVVPKPGYYPTAIVRAALDSGQGLSVGFGWGWQYEATALRSFSELMLLARSDALAVGRDADERAWLVGAVKHIYTRTFGKLQSGDKSRPWSKQPYWYLSLRAESARRMWRAFHSNPDAVGINTDTIFILTDEYDARRAFGGPNVSPFAFNPGAWQYSGTYAADRKLYDLLGQRGAVLADYLRGLEPFDTWGKGN